jgi:hypothetical protein
MTADRGRDSWPEADPIQTSLYLNRLRKELAESDADGGPTIDLVKTRSLVIAAVLQECAARLRVDAEAGAGPPTSESPTRLTSWPKTCCAARVGIRKTRCEALPDAPRPAGTDTVGTPSTGGCRRRWPTSGTR